MKVISARCIHPVRNDNAADICVRYYQEKDGLILCERMSVLRESDYSDSIRVRTSSDNGKNWGEWRNTAVPAYRQYGRYEVLCADGDDWIWNPVHGHYVRHSLERLYRDGHVKSMSEMGDCKEAWSDHAYLFVKGTDGKERVQLVAYEDGEPFDPDDPANPSYYCRNVSYRSNNIVIDENGDLLLALAVPMRKCFELRGEDNRFLFPTEPDVDMCNGVIMVRCRWNGECYEFIPSRPMVISDIQTGRGMAEPTIARLSSGRIVIVTRGCNIVDHPHEKKRLEPGTPAFKWYAFSDDGGKTFTDFMPWHFDNGEVVYSSASISLFLRGERNGKQYWIGNIIPPDNAHNIWEDFPRFPLNIVEIDETYGTAKKETLTVIDTKREGESDYVQLSNFCTYQDRETGFLHVLLTKIGQNWPSENLFQHWPPENMWQAEAWEYEIELD